jgi:hypothetical protein
LLGNNFPARCYAMRNAKQTSSSPSSPCFRIAIAKFHNQACLCKCISGSQGIYRRGHRLDDI